jgi:uncharacterized membrane protein SpoIIM required for sporulation
MALSDFVGAAVAVLRRRPSDVLPMYVLGAAVPAIVRVVPFAGIAVASLLLAATGRLAPLRTHLAELESPPTDPDADPEAVESWAGGLEPIVDLLMTPPLVALAAVTVVASLVVFALASAVVAAGQLAACSARLRDDRGLVAGIAGARRFWPRFLGLFVLEFLCWAAVLAAVGAATALFAGAVSLATGVAAFAAVVVLLAALVAVPVLAAVRALFAFAPVAVVVDDAGVFGSLRNAVGFVRSRPVGAVFYYVLAVGGVLALSTIAGVLSLVDVVSVGSLLSALVLFPALDLLKTALYRDYRGRLAPPDPPGRSLRAGLRAGLRRGWTELASFVRARPGTHALVVALAAGGFWLGWTAAGPFAGTFETSIAARLAGHLPPAAAVELFGNNVLVAATTAYAGVALAVPAIAAVLFNGVFLGIYARLEVDPVELAAFVAPHGIVEIPAILIAGALGISVGVTGWRTARGRVDREGLADALERAFWVLVGVGLLLAIAAVVEGFVSPYYYRPFV